MRTNHPAGTGLASQEVQTVPSCAPPSRVAPHTSHHSEPAQQLTQRQLRISPPTSGGLSYWNASFTRETCMYALNRRIRERSSMSLISDEWECWNADFTTGEKSHIRSHSLARVPHVLHTWYQHLVSVDQTKSYPSLTSHQQSEARQQGLPADGCAACARACLLHYMSVRVIDIVRPRLLSPLLFPLGTSANTYRDISCFQRGSQLPHDAARSGAMECQP